MTLICLFTCKAQAQLGLSRVSSASLPGLTLSAISIDDLNGDGNPDVIMSGVEAGENRSVRLYWGDGMGGFTNSPIPHIPALSEGSISIEDVDGDGDQDLLFTGSSTNGFRFAQTNLFLNDGSGGFSRSDSAGLEALDQSESFFVDVDGDTDPDLLLTGVDTTNAARAILYLNDGTGKFSVSPNQGFEPVRQGIAAVADVDGDLDPDIVLAGWCNSPSGFCHKADLYLNDGSGGFVKNSLILGTTTIGDHAFTDVDGDGDQDLIFSGIEKMQNLTETKVFVNNGAGNFQEMPGNDIPISASSGLVVDDFNRDGTPDLLLAGQFQTAVYTNNGNGIFTEETEVDLLQIGLGDLNAADMDGDGDPDIILSGDLGQFKSGAYYRNDAMALSLSAEETLAVSMYPNPASNSVRIEAESSTPLTVKGYDLLGRLLLQEDIPTGDGDLHFSLPAGVYLLRIEGHDGRQATRRLQVE